MTLKPPGPGVGKKAAKKVDTKCRSIMVTLTEASVKQRKVRVAQNRVAKVRCSQQLLLWYNPSTHMPVKTHKHFADSTSASDVLGPFALEAWNKLPSLTVEEKKAWWGKRRVAVGGKTVTGESESEDGSQELDPEAAEEAPPANDAEAAQEAPATEDVEMVLPPVSQGRGCASLRGDTRQPIAYHEWPVSFWDSVAYACSASTIIVDLTPATGRQAMQALRQRMSYIGICQTECQKEYIEKALAADGLKALSDPSSKLYAPELTAASTKAAPAVPKPAPIPPKATPAAPAKPKPVPKPKTEPKSGEEPPQKKPRTKQGGAPNPELSQALQSMLARAQGKQGE